MKKKFALCLLLALLLCLCLVPAASAAEDIGHVQDTAGILSSDEVRALEERAETLSESCRCAVYIVTVPDYRELNGGDVGACAEGIYSYYDLGYGSGRDGMLLLLSMADRDYALTSYGYYADYCFGDHNKDLVEEAFLDSGLTYSGDRYRYGVTGKLPVGAKLGITVGAPSLIALLVCSLFKAQMKTAKLRTTAEEYVVPGSAALRIKEDRFVNRTQTRTLIQSSSGSRGGGGGGGFHTHTGKF